MSLSPYSLSHDWSLSLDTDTIEYKAIKLCQR